MDGNNTLKGGMFILMAMGILGFIDNFFGPISEDGGLWQFHAVRTTMSILVFVVYARIKGVSLRPTRFLPVLGRSVILGIGMLIYFGCLGLLPIAQVAAGLFTSPIWVLIFSILFFGVRVGLWRFLAMIAGFVGVLLILRPDPSALSFLTIAPIFAGAFWGLGMLTTRAWCEAENSLTLTLVSFLVLGGAGVIGVTVFTLWPVGEGDPGFLLRGWQPLTPRFLFWCAVQAVGSVIAVDLLARGYQQGEASFVTVFEYSFLIFAAGWSFILWGQGVDLQGAVGIAVIIASGAVLALRGRADEAAV
ncbi:DMT family transporter [Aliiroseovarius sp. YM-037]|uniref:DMT family transporter n=1 Tax=Aliiroseovarius sp. YM-037 TaxID=3341728 RepID=UPI003A803F2C